MTPAISFNVVNEALGHLGKICTPWVELADDVAESVSNVVGDVGGLFAPHARESFMFSASPVTLLRGCSASRCGVGAAVLELSEDIVDLTWDWDLAMLLPMPVLAIALSAGALCTVLASGPGAAILSLYSVSSHSETVCVTMSLSMATGAYYTWIRHPDATDMVPQRRGALCLLISGCYYFVSGRGLFPQWWLAHIAHPDMMSHFVQDLFCNPLIILNLGYLAGSTRIEVAPMLTLPLLSTLGCALAATVLWFHTGRGIFCVVLSKGCLTLFSHQLLVELPLRARSTSRHNENCILASSMMFLCSLAASLSTQSLRLIHFISAPEMVQMLAVCDIFSKLTVCYMTTRDKKCLQRASMNMTERARLELTRLPPFSHHASR